MLTDTLKIASNTWTIRVSPVEMSTIILASWLTSRGRFGLLMP